MRRYLGRENHIFMTEPEWVLPIQEQQQTEVGFTDEQRAPPSPRFISKTDFKVNK